MNDNKIKSLHIDSITKVCSICNVSKSIDSFSVVKKGKPERRATCKKCKNKSSMLWREKNRGKSREASKNWRINNPEKYKANYRKQNKTERQKESVKTWIKNNHEKHLNNQYAWRKRNPEKWAMHQRNGQLKRLYGIDHSIYLEMLKTQDGKCKICGSENHNGRGQYFHVDHDHETGIVRGLLCHYCNTVIGCAEDKISTLDGTIRYLELHNEKIN